MTRIIPHDAVRRLLPMGECIDAIRASFVALAEGRAVQPLRSVTWMPDRRGLVAAMPGYLPGTLGMKAISVFSGNAGTPLDTHQGVVLVFDDADGRLRAIVDATEITALRTAAASAVATDALARPDARVLALLGSGTQARSHLEAIPLVRPIEEVRVWSRTREHAERFAATARRKVVVAPSVAEAVAGADVVCTLTSATAPILQGRFLTAGMHVNAVGSSTPSMRELDGEAMRRGRLVTDRRESFLAESGDYLGAVAGGALPEEPEVVELGDVLVGRAAGRRSPSEVTIFESLGLAAEDLAAADLVARRAALEDVGTTVALGGLRR